jgi:hypothetical protein
MALVYSYDDLYDVQLTLGDVFKLSMPLPRESICRPEKTVEGIGQFGWKTGDAARQFLLSFSLYTAQGMASLPSAVHSTAARPDLTMNTITRAEVDTKLEALSAKIGAKIDSIWSRLDHLTHRVEEREKALEAKLDLRDQVMEAKLDLRDRVMDAKFAHLESRVDEIGIEMKEVKRTLSNQRYWIVGTAVGAVLGVGAFNATVLSNMIAAFESGKSISAAQAEILQRSKEMERAIDTIRSRLDALPSPVSVPAKQSPTQSGRSQPALRRRRRSARR